MADTAKIKQENTQLLRGVMQQGEPCSKNELARRTGLSFPTVSRIIDAMVQTGEVRRLGTAASTGGRCARQYALDPAFRLFLCLRLEGRMLYWFVSDLAGTRLEQMQQPAGEDIRQTISTLLTCVKVRYPQLAAVAVGVAGTMREGAVTEAFGWPELRGVSLASFLTEQIGLPALAVRDMHAVVRGRCVQSAPMPRAVVCIYIGASGAGAACALNGSVWSGAHEFAGELHYLPIENNLEYAETHFAGADMTAYCVQVIRDYAALLDPEQIVLYSDPLLTGKIEQIRSACAQVLPAQALPEIICTETLIQDYETGLFALVRALTEEEV